MVSDQLLDTRTAVGEVGVSRKMTCGAREDGDDERNRREGEELRRTGSFVRAHGCLRHSRHPGRLLKKSKSSHFQIDAPWNGCNAPNKSRDAMYYLIQSIRFPQHHHFICNPVLARVAALLERPA